MTLSRYPPLTSDWIIYHVARYLRLIVIFLRVVIVPRGEFTARGRFTDSRNRKSTGIVVPRRWFTFPRGGVIEVQPSCIMTCRVGISRDELGCLCLTKWAGLGKLSPCIKAAIAWVLLFFFFWLSHSPLEATSQFAKKQTQLLLQLQSSFYLGFLFHRLPTLISTTYTVLPSQSRKAG